MPTRTSRPSFWAGRAGPSAQAASSRWFKEIIDDYDFRWQDVEDGRRLVQNILDCSKPIVSAISGAAAGGGLAAALLADISVAGRTAKIVDGHTILASPRTTRRGDLAAALWSREGQVLLLLNEALTGEEAERSASCPSPWTTTPSTTRHSRSRPGWPGGASALRFTKQSLNNWVRAAWPSFEASLAFGILGFTGPRRPRVSPPCAKSASRIHQRSYV